MCVYDVNSTQEIAGYGRVSKPDAAGYIKPVATVSDAEREQRLAAARAQDQASAGTPAESAASSRDSGKGTLGVGSQGVGAAAYRMQNPGAGARETQEASRIALQNAQAQRDLAFVTANTAYLAKNQEKNPNTAAASRTAPAGGGGGGATLLTGGTASNALTAKKPATQGRATLLGM